MYLLLALLALNPWNLMVAVEDEEGVVWISTKYQTEEECEENALLLHFIPPTKGKVVDAYCERDPHTT